MYSTVNYEYGIYVIEDFYVSVHITECLCLVCHPYSSGSLSVGCDPFGSNDPFTGAAYQIFCIADIYIKTITIAKLQL